MPCICAGGGIVCWQYALSKYDASTTLNRWTCSIGLWLMGHSYCVCAFSHCHEFDYISEPQSLHVNLLTYQKSALLPKKPFESRLHVSLNGMLEKQLTSGRFEFWELCIDLACSVYTVLIFSLHIQGCTISHQGLLSHDC